MIWEWVEDDVQALDDNFENSVDYISETSISHIHFTLCNTIKISLRDVKSHNQKDHTANIHALIDTAKADFCNCIETHLNI